MAICQISRLGPGRERRVPMSVFGQAASNKTTSRCLLWLICVVALWNIVALSGMRADAQTSLLDNNAPSAYTGTPPRLSSPSAAYDEATDHTRGLRTSVLVPDPGAEADERQKNAAPREVVGRDAPAPGNPLWRLPLKQFLTTQERPIFSPSRRPPPPAPAYVAPVEVRQPTKPREPERPTIALAGTIIGTDGYRGGVFRDTSSQDVVRLRLGENYHGWVLLLVTPREARLVKNGEQALLELPKQPGAPARARSSQEIALDAIWATGAE